MIEPHATKTIRSLEKAKGQIGTILGMIEKKRYCMDLVQQINAVIGLLRGANTLILESHLHTCGSKLHTSSAEEKEKFIKEIIRMCTVSQRKG